MRRELIWVIIILSIIYIINYMTVPSNSIVNEVKPHDVNHPDKIIKVIPHADLTQPTDLPIVKDIKPLSVRIAPVVEVIQPPVEKPIKCDITIGANRPQFKDLVDGLYKESGSDINNGFYENSLNALSDSNMSWNDSTKTIISNDKYATVTSNETDFNKSVLDKSKILKDIVYLNEKYNFKGVAYNEYYNQYYLLYEYIVSGYSDYVEDNLVDVNYKVAKYILAKEEPNGITIIHAIGPRNQVNYNDVIYFSFGNFQIGPLTIVKV